MITDDFAKLTKDFQNHLDNDFERQLFSAILNNAYQLYNPLLINNFAYSMRELLRIILHSRAPDDELKICCWYNTSNRKPSRRDRMKYMIHGGIDDTFLKSELSLDFDSEVSDALNTINQLNKYTHITPKYFQLQTEEFLPVIQEIFNSLVSFLRCVGCNDVLLTFYECIKGFTYISL